MSGSNGLPKYPTTNRENEFLGLKVRGTFYTQTDQSTITTTPFTASQLYGPVSANGNTDYGSILLNASTPNAITGPTNADIFTVLGQKYSTTAGSTFTIVVHNSDGANAKVINFPGVGTVTIPAGAYVNLGFVVTNQAAQTLAFYNPLNAGAGGSSPTFPAGAGIITQSGGGTLSAVTIVGVSPIVVTNGNGQGGNPTISLSGATLYGNTPGYLTTDGSGGTVARTLTGSPYVTVTNGTGAAGNSVFSVNSALQAVSDSISSASPATGVLLKTGQNTTTVFQGTQTAVTPIVTSLQAVKTFSNVNDVLVWNGTQWIGSQAYSGLPVFNNLLINQNFIIRAAQNYETQGSTISAAAGGWGPTALVGGSDPIYAFAVSDGNVGTNIGTASRGNVVVLLNGPGLGGNAFANQIYRFLQCFNINANFTLTPTSDGSLAFGGGANQNEVFFIDGQGDMCVGGFAYFNKNTRVNGTLSCIVLVQTSIREAKRDIAPIQESVLPLLDKLDPVSFNFKVDEENTPKRVGLIIDDLAEKIKDDGENLLEGLISRNIEGKAIALDHFHLVGLLLASVKELKAEIEELKKKI